MDSLIPYNFLFKSLSCFHCHTNDELILIESTTDEFQDSIETKKEYSQQTEKIPIEKNSNTNTMRKSKEKKYAGKLVVILIDVSIYS